MIRAGVLAGAALVVAWSPALGQSSTVSKAVSNTIFQSCKAQRGMDDVEAIECVDRARAVMAARRGGGTCPTTSPNWLNWLALCAPNLANVWPYPIAHSDTKLDPYSCDPRNGCVGFPDGNPNGLYGGGGGGFNGGGASGSWEMDCEDFLFRLDAIGNLIVPSIPLPPGPPMVTRRSGGATNAWYYTCSNIPAPNGCTESGWIGANKYAAALYTAHKGNTAKGTDRRNWLGAWRITATGVEFRGQNYVDNTGTIKGYNGGYTTTTFGANFYYNNAWDDPKGDCPLGGAVGGNFDYYVEFTSTTNGVFGSCVHYAPHESLGPSGYAYPETVAITWAQVDSYVTSFNALAECPIDPALIQKIADDLMKDAEGPDHVPVKPEDVRTDDEEPDVKDVAEDPPALPEPDEDAPPPTSQPDDPPSSGGGTIDLGPDPGVGSPTLEEPPSGIMDPIFDWLPDLPSIEISVAGATCPTWEMQPFEGPEWHLTMDAHCPFIEDNRAAIGALMVILFTIGAALIILRA